MRCRSQKAMTIMEILIGAAIMSIAAIGIYELFFSGAKTAALSMWRTKSNTELRNTFQLLRNDMGRASYPSTITDMGTDIEKDVKCTIAGGRTEAGSDKTLVDFYMCKPEMAIAGTNKAGERIHCVLALEGNKIRYTRDGPNPMNKVVISDVEYVDISSEAAADDAEKSVVTIEVGTIHPKFETTKVIDKTTAKVEVEVVGGS